MNTLHDLYQSLSASNARDLLLETLAAYAFAH
jgi:hypothetical protein